MKFLLFRDNIGLRILITSWRVNLKVEGNVCPEILPLEIFEILDEEG